MKHPHPVCGAICPHVSFGSALMASVGAHAADIRRDGVAEAKGVPG
jgi:hypothetical protein